MSKKKSKKEIEKEEEIIESYEEEQEEVVEVEEEYEEVKEDKKDSYHKNKRMINILFVIVLLFLLLPTIDIICVSKYKKGPFFAIPVKTHTDGGTKEYYGLGYKVIKYRQDQGRRDLELGTWDLQYDTTALTVQDLDLAIEFVENEQDAYVSYYKEFVRIMSTLREVDTKKHQITIGYHDEDGKYSLDVICEIVPEQKNLSTFQEEKEITIIGTVKEYKPNTDKKPNTLIIENCFAEQ